MLLIFPLLCTFKISSEYKSTASVFSSCGGNGAFTSACIHCGASAACAARGANTQQNRTTVGQNAALRTTLISSAAGHRLQHDLLLIARPHRLIEIAHRRVVFRIEHRQPELQP